MAVYVKNRRGKDVTLLNPSEKGHKFAIELKYNVALTNDGVEKRTKKGKVKSLSDTQKAYRSGYLAAQKDSAKAFKHNLKKKKR